MNVFCPHCGKASNVSPDELGNVAEYEYLEADCPYCHKGFKISTSLLFQDTSRLNQAQKSIPRQSQRPSAQLPSYSKPEAQRRNKKVSWRNVACAVIVLVVVAISFDYVEGTMTHRKYARFRQQFEELNRNMVPIPGRAFSICKYEVTQALWESVMGTNPSFNKGDNLPVENVSFADCLAFVRKLNEKKRGIFHSDSHHDFHLPSKWQWEIASLGGVDEDAGEYGFCKLADGKIIQLDTLDTVAWYAPNSARQTHPVGQKTPNAFGLYDMFGNVSEWIDEGRKPGDTNKFYFGGSYRDNAKDCVPINIIHSSRIYPSSSPSPDRGLRLVRPRDVDYR